MSTFALPIVTSTPGSSPAPPPDERWLRAARRARQLSWLSLAWMSVEGIVGLIAGLDANALSLIAWASTSFVEGLASLTIIWRFTGSRLHSPTSERTAQRCVAGTFLLLVPYFLYEALERVINGSHPEANALGIFVTASAIILMPALGWAKLRLARTLDSGATAGEGIQNLMCAAEAAAAMTALIAAGAGLAIIDPIATVAISAVAVRECIHLWRGDSDDCCAPIGFEPPTRPHCDCC